MEEAAPGKQLGRLDILAELHLGRNGEFFRALDTRSGQDVAVKVFPLERGVEFRFEKRHHKAAGLKHPNILSVQRLLSKPGISYFITEPLNGHALQTVLRRGPMSPRDVIDIGMKVADGLATGHEADILHGDLNPENVLIGDEGVVKILDFGFARQLPTLLAIKENPKIPVEGPFAYMAPEQVRGEPIDARTDVFSLGSMLYEMATGRPPFERDTPLETMHAIVEANPDEPPSRVPSELITLMGHCLEKDPANRFQTAHELAAGLRSLEQTSQLKHSRRPKRGNPVTRAAKAIFRYRRPAWAAAVVGAAVALIAAAVFVRNWERQPKINEYQRITFRQGSILRARFAPAGKGVVYTARFDGSPQASYFSAPGSSDGREIPLPPVSSIAAVSSKGDLAVRLKTGELVRVPLDGGLQEQIQTNVFDADWAPDGNSLAVARHAGQGGKFRVEYPVGNPLFETDELIELVRISPQGDRVAFTTVQGLERKLWVVSKPGGTSAPPQMLTSLGKGEPLRAICWSPDGGEIWYGNIESITPGGTKRRVAWVPDLSLDDVARDGKTLVQTIRSWSGVGLHIPERNVFRDLSWHGQTINALLSSDGERLAFTEYGEGAANYGTYARATDGSPAQSLGEGEAVAMSPDGLWVTAYNPQGQPRYSLLPSSPGDASPIVIPSLEDRTGLVAGWLADGRRLVWGKEPGKKSRHFLWTPTSDQIEPITPEGTPLGYVMADGSRILAGGTDNQPHVYSSDGTPATLALGLRPSDRPLRWANDGESMFVASQESDRETAIFKVNLTDGARVSWLTLDPPIEANAIVARSITPDGKMVAYSYYRSQGKLFVGSSLR